MAVMTVELAMRSQDACWDRERWAKLPADGNRYEVIERVLYMSTSPSLFHQWIVLRAYDELKVQLADPGLAFVFVAPVGVFMPGCDPVQPDLVVLRSDQASTMQEGAIHGVPALLIEVLSPSHPDVDLRVKRQAYARAGVPEYWIFRPATRDVMVCSKPDAALGDYGNSELVSADGELVSATLPFSARAARFFEGSPDTTL